MQMQSRKLILSILFLCMPLITSAQSKDTNTQVKSQNAGDFKGASFGDPARTRGIFKTDKIEPDTLKTDSAVRIIIIRKEEFENKETN